MIRFFKLWLYVNFESSVTPRYLTLFVVCMAVSYSFKGWKIVLFVCFLEKMIASVFLIFSIIFQFFIIFFKFCYMKLVLSYCNCCMKRLSVYSCVISILCEICFREFLDVIKINIEKCWSKYWALWHPCCDWFINSCCAVYWHFESSVPHVGMDEFYNGDWMFVLYQFID